jgi:hypothetical protein
MIESYVAQGLSKPTLIVFEKVTKDGSVTYLQQVKEVSDDTP